MSKETKTSTSKARPGRRTREEMGLEPLEKTSIKVENSIILECRKKFGSLANALRYAAKIEV
jgi:hypothetical protein